VPLLLLIGVLTPTACVLWFMNVAVNNQRAASRRTLAEAYRGQLALLRDRVDAWWALRASDLERETREGAAPAVFERVVKLGLADSVVVMGRAPYPSVGGGIATDPVAGRADWMAAQTLESWRDASMAPASWAAIARSERDPALGARAAQARIRCLVRAGDKEAAIRAVEEEFPSSQNRKNAFGFERMQATDPAGRVISADELLLAIHLMQPEDVRRAAFVRRLAAMVNDYGGTARGCESAPSRGWQAKAPAPPLQAADLPLVAQALPPANCIPSQFVMPAAQRLFLLEELCGAAEFPTCAAERLGLNLGADDYVAKPFKGAGIGGAGERLSAAAEIGAGRRHTVRRVYAGSDGA
jgi:hypothetical protein